MGLAHSALLQLSLSSSSSPCMMLSSSSSVKCRHWNQTWRDSALFHLKSIKLCHFILYLVILESALRQYQCNCFISSHNSVITNSRTQVSGFYILPSFPVCALLQICGLGKVGSLHRGVIGLRQGCQRSGDQVRVRILASRHLPTSQTITHKHASLAPEHLLIIKVLFFRLGDIYPCDIYPCDIYP